MWAWLWQRISALAIVVLLALHLTLTYKPFIQFLLLLVVTFHAALGLRVILLDFNLVGVKYQRALDLGPDGLGLVVVATNLVSRSTRTLSERARSEAGETGE